MNFIQKIVEDFNFNSIRNNRDSGSTFAENALGLIDLGLPSGILWCECNLGAENEYDYGDYCAWGEVITKDNYDDENYTYNKSSEQLPPECDVATQILGGGYSIPTYEQWNELLKYTNKKCIKNYKDSGINGMLFVSKLNDNSIFIPAAGYRKYSIINDDNVYGNVWSSSLNSEYPNYANCLCFSSHYASLSNSERYYGLSIRPVFKK